MRNSLLIRAWTLLLITVSKSVFATSSYPKCPSFTHLQFHHRTRFSGFLVLLYEVWLWSLMLIEKNGNEMLVCCLFDARMCNKTMAWRRLATLLVYTVLCQDFHFQKLSVNWLLSTVLLTTFLICHRTSFIGRVFLTLEWIFVSRGHRQSNLYYMKLKNVAWCCSLQYLHFVRWNYCNLSICFDFR